MQNRLLELVEQSSMKTTIPKFEVGDTVDVHVRILEGEKGAHPDLQRRRDREVGDEDSRDVRGAPDRAGRGRGYRKFPVHSPRIADITVNGRQVRFAKLY